MLGRCQSLLISLPRLPSNSTPWPCQLSPFSTNPHQKTPCEQQFRNSCTYCLSRALLTMVERLKLPAASGAVTDEFRKVLRILQRLPQIRSTIILSDSVSMREPGNSSFRSVQYFTMKMAGLGVADCIDIGKYQLRGRYSKISIVNRKLTRM
jgi:hypothetical protein